MSGFFRERRRRRLRKTPVSAAWRAIIARNVAFFQHLPLADRTELLGDLQVFLDEKRFEGCDGLKITDEMRVTIAAQACLLLLHRKTDYYPRLVTILVYPSGYFAEETLPLSAHIWQEQTVGRLGETARAMGSLVLAWDAAKAGGIDAGDGRNLVLHEFAHQLDFEDSVADGVPALRSREEKRSWAEVMKMEFEALRAAEEAGIPSLLDHYGATNPAEFFAVATEAFFERPRALRASRPELYEVMQRFFRQDPTLYFRAEESLNLQQTIS